MCALKRLVKKDIDWSDCLKCKNYREDKRIKGYVDCKHFLLPEENCLLRKIKCCKYEI